MARDRGGAQRYGTSGISVHPPEGTLP